MSEGLKPCPFCGANDAVETDMEGMRRTVYFVSCNKCGAAGPSRVYPDHSQPLTEADLWNRRASPAPEPGDERNRLTQIFLKCARFKIYIDGNKWCATFDDFENLQESPVGFGDDEYEAVVALLEDFE